MTSDNASTGLDLEEHARMLQQQLDEALDEVETFRAEVERLRAGIREHRDDLNPQCVTSGDLALWALLDEIEVLPGVWAPAKCECGRRMPCRHCER